MGKQARKSKYGPLTILLILVLVVVVFALSVQREPRQVVAQTVLPLEGDSIPVLVQINHAYQSVRHIFEQSCFDCHSAYTEFPWYRSLPLAGGFLEDHVKHGRDHLDLTEDFPFKGAEDQLKILQEIKHEIDDNEMPLWSYRLLHWRTAIEGPRRDSVFVWIDSSLALLRTAHTAESQ